MVASLRGMQNMSQNLSNRKAFFYFIGLMYPVTLSASWYHSLKGPLHDFHPHRSKINIMQKSEDIQKKRENIIEQVLNLYNCRPNRNTEFIYEKDATFEDPFIYMNNKNAITAMIHGLPLITREFKTDSDTIEHYEDAILIKHNVTFQLGIWFRGSFPCTQYLLLNDTNDKIKKHKNMWNNKPLFHFHGVTKCFKYINGNWIARTIFGLPSG
eukprot:108793_1